MFAFVSKDNVVDEYDCKKLVSDNGLFLNFVPHSCLCIEMWSRFIKIDTQ